MRFKLVLLSSCLVCVFYSCNISNKYSDNNLIPNEITVKYEHLIPNQQSSEIFSCIDKKQFAEKLIQTTLAAKIAVYDPLDTAKQLSKVELTKLIGSWNDTIVGIDEKRADTALVIRQYSFNKDELQKILFVENWAFDSKRFVMTKEVKQWCPVRVYNKRIDSNETEEIKKMLFWYKQTKPQANNNLTLLKANLTYEFELSNQAVPTWTQDLNAQRFIDILLDNVLQHKTIAYDFFDSKKHLSDKEIMENLGETTKNYTVENPKTGNADTLVVHQKMDIDEIKDVIFVEDWYIDWNTMMIVKKVKSIAPVRVFPSYTDAGEEETIKKIPFIVHLN